MVLRGIQIREEETLPFFLVIASMAYFAIRGDLFIKLPQKIKTDCHTRNGEFAKRSKKTTRRL